MNEWSSLVRSDPRADQVLRVFQSYAAAFRALDPSGVAEHFDLPCLLLSPRGNLAGTTAADVERFYAGVMANARSRGYATTEFEQLNARLLDANTAAVTGHGKWKTDHGMTIMRFELAFILRRVDGRWKIAVSDVRGSAGLHRPS